MPLFLFSWLLISRLLSDIHDLNGMQIQKRNRPQNPKKKMIRAKPDEAGRSRTKPDEAGRSRTKLDEAGRSRTKPDEVGRSWTNLDEVGWFELSDFVELSKNCPASRSFQNGSSISGLSVILSMFGLPIILSIFEKKRK